MNLLERIRRRRYHLEQMDKINKAIERSKKENKKFMVLVINGNIVVRSKQEIKQMIRQKQIRHSIQEVEKRAIYVTNQREKEAVV